MTREWRRRGVVICLIGVAGAAWTAGQKEEWVAFARGATMSPAEDSQQILVCDDQRKVVGKWPVPRTAMLMGISCRRGCVYVAHRQPLRVPCYSFLEGGRPSHVWQIPVARSLQ